MTLNVYRNGKKPKEVETYKIKNFEISNYKESYISFELKGVLGDIIHIDIEDLQEVYITEDKENDSA